MVRLSRVLKPYRGWPDPEVGSRWGLWSEAVEADEAVKATTSSDELYLDSYERYAGTTFPHLTVLNIYGRKEVGDAKGRHG